MPDNLRGLLRDLPLPSRRAILLGWGLGIAGAYMMNALPEQHRPKIGRFEDFWAGVVEAKDSKDQNGRLHGGLEDDCGGLAADEWGRFKNTIWSITMNNSQTLHKAWMSIFSGLDRRLKKNRETRLRIGLMSLFEGFVSLRQLSYASPKKGWSVTSDNERF